MAKILLVEDNDNIRQLYERLLFKYEVVGVTDGQQACQALDLDRFDLVVLDMYLPEISGLQVLKRIRISPHYRHTPVFVISSDDQLEKDAQNLGIQLWMTKPIDVRVLLDAIQRQLV